MADPTPTPTYRPTVRDRLITGRDPGPRRRPSMRAATPEEVRADQLDETQGIGASRARVDPDWAILTALARSQRRDMPAPQPPFRQTTWRDWIGEKVGDLYSAAAAHPLGQASDALGLSDLAAIAGRAAAPPQVDDAAAITALPPPGGTGAAKLAKAVEQEAAGIGRVAALRSVSEEMPRVLLTDPEPLPAWTSGKGRSHLAKIESGRDIVANEALSPDDLKALLSEFSPRDAAKVTKGMPVTPPRRGPLGRAVTRTPERGVYAAGEELAQRIADFHKIGRALPRQVTWGPSQHPELLHGFGGEPEMADLFGQLFAATSANTSVAKNTAETVSLLHYLLGNPETSVITAEMLQNLPYQKVTQAPSKTPNVNKAWWGLPLGGPKVGPFGRFMGGIGNAAPDVHALYGWGSPAKAITEELPGLRTAFTRAERLARSGGLTNDELVSRFLHATDEVLRTLEPNRSTAAIFGDFWEGVRAHKGQGYQGSYIDILRNKGLLEWGKLLDRRALGRVLREGGWSALSIAGLMAALGPEGGEGGEDASQVGAPPPMLSVPPGQGPAGEPGA